MELIEKSVVEVLEYWFADYKVNFTGKYRKQDYTNYTNAISSCNDKLNTLHSQLSNAYDFLEQGIYTVDVFRQRSITLQNEIAETEKVLKKIKAEYENKLSEEAILNNFIPHTEQLLGNYYTLDVKSRNDILHQLLIKVTYIKTEKGTRNKPAPFKIKIYPKILKAQP